MSWWSPSWLPSFSSLDFSLPSSIQKRFISFALKRSLGHFLKPGQLDIQQVDSQIGAGYVQVRDLELDNDAINSLLAGLPLQLHDGSIGKVTARIPWPNPLTSTIGLSLESLRLTLHIAPNAMENSTIPSVDLAESVASVAESFIHDELSPGEEATLRESLHPEAAASSPGEADNFPGGLDPFIADDEVTQSETQPPGVSIFATLIERLLARFAFDAVDTKITLVHPQHTSLTLVIPEIRYGTEAKDVTVEAIPAPDAKKGELKGEVRTVTVSGVHITTRCLRPASPPMLTPSGLSSASQGTSSQLPMSLSQSNTSPPSSPHSDSSDMDEDTQLMMSQSIAAFPPRAVSPVSSVASSLYQSALSAVSETRFEGRSPSDQEGRSHTPIPSPRDLQSPSAYDSPTAQPSVDPHAQSRLGIRTGEIEDETIVSFGSESIVIRLTTTAPRSGASAVEQPVASPSSRTSARTHTKAGKGSEAPTSDEKVRVSISIGVIACAFRSRHLRGIMDITQLWSAHSPPIASNRDPTHQDGSTSNASIVDALEANLHLRGIVVLLLPASRPPLDGAVRLSEFFGRPLAPQKLPHGFVRIHFDDLSASLLTIPTPKLGATPSGVRKRTSALSRGPTVAMSLTLTLSELSAFAFLVSPESGIHDSSPDHVELYASPLLITDPHLPSQYPSQRMHPGSTDGHYPALPTFEVIDWTATENRSSTAKLSLWRTKLPQHLPSQAHPHFHQADNRSPPSIFPASPRGRARDLTMSSSPTSAQPVPSITPASPGRSPPIMAGSSIRSHEPPRRPHRPAMAMKVRFSSLDTDRSRSKKTTNVEAEISFEPLHIFIDCGLVLGRSDQRGQSEVLAFLEDIASSGDILEDEDQVDYSDENYGKGDNTPWDEADTPPGTPRPRVAFEGRRNQQERERERRRLERLVLEDLDLGFDYIQNVPEPKASEAASKVQSWRERRKRLRTGQSKTTTVKFPMVRIEIRCPPPSSYAPRSGALILDVHDLELSPGPPIKESQQSATRFATVDDAYTAERPGEDIRNALLSANWARVVVAYALVTEERGACIVSLGSRYLQRTTENVQFGAGAYLDAQTSEPPSRPHIHLSKVKPLPSSTSPRTPTLAVTIDIPSIHVDLSKPILDGLQLWADDLTQLMEVAMRESATWDSETERAGSREASLIGSRYFAKRTRSQASSTESGTGSIASREPSNSKDETVVKVTIGSAVVRLFLPRQTEGLGAIRPFDISASDIDVLLELKPEGRDETVLTLSVMDLTIKETAESGSTTNFLGLTPYSLVSTPRSALQIRFTSLIVPETTSKESRVKLTLCGITFNVHPDFEWANDLGRFVKAPPGAFESVVPNERTRITVKIIDSSVRTLAPKYPGAVVMYVGELSFSTVIIGQSAETSFHLEVPDLSMLLIDDVAAVSDQSKTTRKIRTETSEFGLAFWKVAGYALLAEIVDLDIRFQRINNTSLADTRVVLKHGKLQLHLCADTITALTCFINDFGSVFSSASEKQDNTPRKRSEPTRLSDTSEGLLSSLDEQAFHQLPEVGAAPDMIHDDLPTNLDYLDESFGAAAGLRELDDDDFDEFDVGSKTDISEQPEFISKFGGETIKMLLPEGLRVAHNHFFTMTPDSTDGSTSYGDTTSRVRIHDCEITLFLYDGYDWVRTRRIIEDEQREMRRRLAKIRQLVANGQTPDPSVEETNMLLFNSVYIGLEHNVDELEPGALIAAIDEELNEELETASQSSWQSLKPQPQITNSPGRSGTHTSKNKRKRMNRSRGPSIEFRLSGLNGEIDRYMPEAELVTRTLVTIRDVEILDHIKTSTWRKFLTALREDSRGNIRETDSNMVRVELRSVHPVLGHPSEEARLKAKILPLRLHVDQDALDFLKKFFSFRDPDSTPTSNSEPSDEIYFQQAEIFPVDIKLDYKPRRVDYRALRDGKTIELMNFFHFDGAEMTLRHITLTGITGWPRLFDLLNDLWTPDVKATQLVDVISGVSPIRSVVNVGSGVADLVLLPISQYKKDGRVIRGLQKGGTAFVRSTAAEAAKMGAKMATGTQVILEQAEHVIGGQFKDPITAELVQGSPFIDDIEQAEEVEGDLISRYAEQPTNVKEGVQLAYRSLKKNLNSAAQTILAVPMEVYERSGNEGPVRAVVRAVPIAVLKPMIGASEAVSKTLLGLHNSLDPNVRHENEAKYKHR